MDSPGQYPSTPSEENMKSTESGGAEATLIALIVNSTPVIHNG
jgi:hypothetical protein